MFGVVLGVVAAQAQGAQRLVRQLEVREEPAQRVDQWRGPGEVQRLSRPGPRAPRAARTSYALRRRRRVASARQAPPEGTAAPAWGASLRVT